MKRKIFVSILILAALVFSVGAAKKNDEIKRMGIFISNFTELSMYDFDLEEYGDDDMLHLGDPDNMEELIRFGIGHNVINNKKLILKCTRKKCEYGNSTIKRESVAASVKKYFDLTVKHQSVFGDAPEAEYDGKLYHFNKNNWNNDTIYYADVQNVKRSKRIITMSGELYELDNPKNRPATFVATAKPHTWNDKDTWAILSLKVEWK